MENLDIKKVQAFFFDFDGVLVDSVEVKTKAFARLFEPFGRDIVQKVMEHHRAHGGMTRTDKFHYYYKEFLRRPLKAGRMDQLCRRFSEIVMKDVIAASEIPGAEAFLKLWHLHLPCFIISATPEDELLEIVHKRGLSEYFREIKGFPPDKKQILSSLVKHYSLIPESCWFFGDAVSDYMAARACNVNFIGIINDNSKLLPATSDFYHVRNFNHLSNFFPDDVR